MPDDTYQPKVYRRQGGDEMVVASGGAIEVESGGVIQAPEIADANEVGAMPVLHRKTLADAATGNVEIDITHKTRIIDAWVVKTTADGHATEDTITIGNGANAITDAMAIGANNDTSLTRAATIDDAQHEIAAGGALRISWVKGAGGGNNVACEVYVLGVRVA